MTAAVPITKNALLFMFLLEASYFNILTAAVRIDGNRKLATQMASRRNRWMTSLGMSG